MSDSKQHLALIVDDEADIRELLSLTLERMQVQCLSAETVAEAHALLEANRFDLCLTDMRLPDGNGIELVRHIQQEYPQLPVAMISAHGNMDSAIEALKAGAFDFISKPVELQTLRELVQSALLLAEPAGSEAANGSERLLGRSAVIAQIRQTIAKLARSQAPVYISGESGSGKELVARLIHEQGARRNGPFIAVNCGAIPSELMESELFGHKKGSFTGASADKEGLFQAANGGTLFLDEVADLPLAMQVKLLRAIQEKAVRAIGARKEDHVDVRILSATHKDLAALVSDGAFREDLFYRVNVIELHLPSLRERREDIPVLIEHLLGKLVDSMGLSEPPRLSHRAEAALLEYDFPGNVRELENILERALTLCEGEQIETGDLGLRGAEDLPEITTPAPPRAGPLPTTTATVTGHSDDDTWEAVRRDGLEGYLEGVEKQLLSRALEESRYNKTAAAGLLGISFRAFRYRLKKLGLD